MAVRRGDVRLRPRTQDSIAVFAREDAAVLCNASPDIARQVAATPALQPRARRHTPISAIVLTNGDLDHVLGIFSLRESQPLSIYATETVQRGIVERNAISATLRRVASQAVWRELALDRDTPLLDPVGAPTGVIARAFAVPGQPPVHLAGVVAPSPQDNIGVSLRCGRTGAHVMYVPGAASIQPGLGDDADVLLFDGTFWSSDELARVGVGSARAEEMGHVPVGGTAGSLARLGASTARRKLFTHVNNTNPMLLVDSRERRAVRAAGWDVAEDGMELL
jgi:pyrroloquinoline quinone biosynthesis protein B